MKKNITINMFGRLYAIDEDAYQLLQQYIDTLRKYFSRKPDGKEIADDIEGRIAELFDDLKAEGVEAINIEHVQDIISRIGDPKQMEDGVDEESDRVASEASADEPETVAGNVRDTVVTYFERLRKSNKRLYRDPSDKKLTGLLAGCARYFGGDPLWWRVGFVLLFSLMLWLGTFVDDILRFTFFGPLSAWLLALYVVMAILTPVAANPEDRLMMKGVDVTPRNLAQEVTEEHTRADIPSEPRRGAAGCLSVVGKVLILKTLLAMAGIMALLALVALSTILVLLMTSPDIFGDSRFTHLFTTSVSPALTAVCLAGVLGVLAVSVYSAVHAIMSSRQNLEPMGTGQRLLWIGLWLVSLLAAIISCVAMTARYSQAEDKLSEAEDRAYVKANTHNGVFIERDDWDYLIRGGWQLIEPTGERTNYTDCGQHFTGKSDMRYLNGYADWGLSYQVERTKTDVAPGTYTLTVAARTDGKGAFVYAVADGQRYMAEIPVSGEEGGRIWKDARQYLANQDSVANGANRQYYQDIADANNGKGFGWNLVTISGIRVTKGSVTYGVSTRSGFTGREFVGQWVSATDFSLK